MGLAHNGTGTHGTGPQWGWDAQDRPLYVRMFSAGCTHVDGIDFVLSSQWHRRQWIIAYSLILTQIKSLIDARIIDTGAIRPGLPYHRSVYRPTGKHCKQAVSQYASSSIPRSRSALRDYSANITRCLSLPRPAPVVIPSLVEGGTIYILNKNERLVEKPVCLLFRLNSSYNSSRTSFLICFLHSCFFSWAS